MVNVFGGYGFIGSAYSDKYEVICNEKLNYVPQTTDILYFISTVDNYNVFKDLHKDINTNLNTLMRVLGNCENPHQFTFNFISSWFVYGDAELPAREDSPCNPKGFYSITKRAAEQLLISYCETFGMKYRILRLGNVIGTQNAPNSPKKNAIQYLISQLRLNAPVDLYEGGKVFRDYIYIDDCVDAINLVIEKGELNSIYNIATGYPTELLKVILDAKELIGSTSVLNPIETPKFHKVVQVKNMYLNVDKLNRLGFIPNYRTPDLWLPKLLEK